MLNQRPIATQEERALWYAEVQQLRAKFRSLYKEIYDALPHELEHYLDDADIRAKDAGYRARQEQFIAKFLEFTADEIRKGRVEK